jgi:hypothetical protein
VFFTANNICHLDEMNELLKSALFDNLFKIAILKKSRLITTNCVFTKINLPSTKSANNLDRNIELLHFLVQLSH